VLFAVNTGLRPDETWRLQFRDVTIVDDEDLDKTILEIEVRGKRGVGYCKSMPGAVRPFERLRSRLRPPRVYGVNTPAKMSMTSVALSEQWRTPGPTDLRLMEGADIYQIAKNCRTSVEMILRGAHQDLARRRCNQRPADQEKQERQESRPEHSGFTATS
jgi:hypothetical protein